MYTTSHLTFATSPPTARVAAPCVKASPASQPASPQGSLLGAPPSARWLVSRRSKPFIHPPTATITTACHPPCPLPIITPIPPTLLHHRRRRERRITLPPARDFACQAVHTTACLALPAQGVLFRLHRASVSACFHPSPLCSFTTRRPRLSQGLPTAETSDGRRRYA